MAAVAALPRRDDGHLSPSSEMLNTIPDPRNMSTPSIIAKPGSSSSHHPDLSNEVAALSNKLINAINHQTALDDNLAAARQELENARGQIRRLEQAEREHAELIATGALLRREDVDEERSIWKAELAEEKEQKSIIARDKKKIDQELETLTAALFEEANQMVAAERKERDKVDRKNDQLKSQIKDMETLLTSHQEQLAELKAVMQQMNVDRDETENTTTTSTAPSTPAFPSQDKDNMSRFLDALNLSPNTPGAYDIPPAPPTSFSHLLHPILRTDTQAYDEFRSLLQLSRTSAPPSRVSSGSYSGLNVMSLAGFGHNKSSSNPPSNASSISLATAVGLGSSRSTPSSPNANNSKENSGVSAPLKDTQFYKRAIVEDVEPTLRLELSPGLSWLARRAVISSIGEGNLVVEPMPPSLKKYHFSCGLCGEYRKGEDYERAHRIRTNETDSASRYPLCPFCLNRVRATCDYMGFLRMIRDGHWRTDGAGGEKAAWEESVRLRERMFWARIGGGVVPAFLQGKESPRNSTTDDDKHTHEVQRISPNEPSLNGERSSSSENIDPFKSNEKRASIGNTVISKKEMARTLNPRITDASNVVGDDPSTEQLKSNLRDSLKSNISERRVSLNSDKGLSITIP
ncbi:MAG: rab guanine nucleotide exchange factor S2 [Cirrosporium novae-zelandiae]|nr:MAG: rab guanine nucleotide exchange factor S2 [Cirrosporium novae-zelandiae]